MTDIAIDDAIHPEKALVARNFTLYKRHSVTQPPSLAH
jgi:hypothetical protein